ncbi:hypothetical protein [aff. Roholtiella sp. LEGE 12411]|nr:hypothetical protein [aff. Roholtiella sp. LEGE 12411]
MNLRSATLADLGLLRHWDEQPHVIASDQSLNGGLAPKFIYGG